LIGLGYFELKHQVGITGQAEITPGGTHFSFGELAFDSQLIHQPTGFLAIDPEPRPLQL